MDRLLTVLCAVLLFGCAAPSEMPAEQAAEEQEKNISEELISVATVDETQVVKIKTLYGMFQLDEYEDEFIDAGLHSDSFIQLSNEHISFLEEEEAVWLTPDIKDGRGVLFNAIYSREMTSCNPAEVEIMGKEYSIKELEASEDFESDSRWKLHLSYEAECLKRIIIYMDGYFYDLEDYEEISLFRDDNTIVLSFRGLENEPRIDIVATKP